MVEQGAEDPDTFIRAAMLHVAVEKHPEGRKQCHVILGRYMSPNHVRGHGYTGQ
jgi:hypothetical protein